MKNKKKDIFRGLIIRIFIFVLLFGICIALTGNASAQSGNINWNGWNFSYEAGADRSGLVLTDVAYNDKKILNKASMPVMRVQYDGDVCGPYADILSTATFEPATEGAQNSACDNKALCERTFTQDGQEKLELGVNIQIGEYQIYQSYYFTPDGTMDARVFSRGLQCYLDHNHHPHWLFDFDIGDAENDQILKNDSELQTTEFNDRKGSSQFWTVRDTVTGDSVKVLPSAGDGVFDNFSQWDVAGRKFVSSETINWQAGARGEIGDLYNNNESIDGQDIVFWYVAHLRHLASEGSELWHASGPTLQVNNGTPAPPPNTAPSLSFTTPTMNTSLTTGVTIDVAVTASDAEGSVSNVKLYMNDQLVGQDNSSPYTWGAEASLPSDLLSNLLSNLAAGDYTLEAVATDDVGLEATTSISIVVADAPIAMPPVDDSNLLSNPNFDSNINSWISCGGNSSVATVASGELYLSDSGCVYQELSATVGQAYKLSCDAKQIGTAWTSVQLSFSDSNFATLSNESVAVTTSSYSNYSVSLNAPEQANYVVAVMYSEDVGNFDNCKLVEDDGATTGASENLLRNAGFESDLDGWFNCGYYASNIGIALNIALGVGSSEKSASVKNGGCMYQEARAEAGASYTLTCKAKTTSTSYTSLSFGFSDAAYQELANDSKVVNTTSFTDYSMTLTAPVDTRNAVVVFYSEGDSNFDDCTIIKN